MRCIPLGGFVLLALTLCMYGVYSILSLKWLPPLGKEVLAFIEGCPTIDAVGTKVAAHQRWPLGGVSLYCTKGLIGCTIQNAPPSLPSLQSH